MRKYDFKLTMNLIMAELLVVGNSAGVTHLEFQSHKFCVLHLNLIINARHLINVISKLKSINMYANAHRTMNYELELGVCFSVSVCMCMF